MTVDPPSDLPDSDYLKRPDAQGHLKVFEVLRLWDPIGVADIAPDEYDGYAPEIVRMLDGGIDTEQLERWLIDLANGHMGLSHVDQPHTRSCADELTKFWHSRRDL
ncbi:MAG: hypothetical protein AAGH99_01460 [Planctomycetota bacterium]